MKINTIHKGNCVEVMEKEIPNGSIDLIFADPPYNLSGNGLKWVGNKTGGDWFMVNEKWDKMTETEYLKFTKDWLNACKKVLKLNGSIYVSCTYHNIGELITVLKLLEFTPRNIITWHKNNAMPSMTRRSFTHSCEYVLFFSKGKKWTFNYSDIKKMNPDKAKDGSEKQMRDLWIMPVVQGKERIKDKTGRAAHPTQKPENLLERIILASSNKNDIVLDPFLGSGTTAVVAKRLDRKWIGIETENKYIKIAEKRLST
ncbi:MAG: site-specific DNA-methyltransferase [Candidatus Pacebacteria bacterium]|nr:site-specific DNA-methyltransferase [Candidatus Paceibacterota bacterium]